MRTPSKRSNVKVTRPLYWPPCWRVRQLQRWAWKRVGRGKQLITSSSARRRKSLRRPRGEERGGAYRGGRPPTACSFCSSFSCVDWTLLLDIERPKFHFIWFDWLEVDLSLVAVWCSGNALVLINAVALHRARLVLGWVTAFGQVNWLTT